MVWARGFCGVILKGYLKMADDKLDAPAFLRMLAQNDYMIDKGMLSDGRRLEEIATEIDVLRRNLESAWDKFEHLRSYME